MTQSKHPPAKPPRSPIRRARSPSFRSCRGTMGPDVIDIRKLYDQTDHFTFDPGYTSTGSCESKITFIDGDKGVLLHRGYKIEDLAEKSDFMEVSYLMLLTAIAERRPESRVRAFGHLSHHGA